MRRIASPSKGTLRRLIGGIDFHIHGIRRNKLVEKSLIEPILSVSLRTQWLTKALTFSASFLQKIGRRRGVPAVSVMSSTGRISLPSTSPTKFMLRQWRHPSFAWRQNQAGSPKHPNSACHFHTSVRKKIVMLSGSCSSNPQKRRDAYG